MQDALKRLPRVAIGTWPTPVVRMEHASKALGCDVWIKVEEDCGTWGGNKVRKLEYIVGTAQRDGVCTFVSYGPGTSNWTTALAFHAHRLGFHTVAGIAGPIPAHYAALYRSTATRVVSVPTTLLSPVANVAARVVAGPGARSLPPGGSGPGDAGSVHAGLEIADAIDANEIPPPRAVFVAAGTAGTAAGLSVGFGARGLKSPVVAVRVTALPYGTPRLVRKHVRALCSKLGFDPADAAPIVGDDRFVAPGYAQPNPTSMEAADVALADGITLDATYSAKAFAALIASIKDGARGPLLFLHTSPGPVPGA
ncbi:MAG: pyridoxal-phosphate dependent enzyme [Actinomycetota bacterium]